MTLKVRHYENFICDQCSKKGPTIKTPEEREKQYKDWQLFYIRPTRSGLKVHDYCPDCRQTRCNCESVKEESCKYDDEEDKEQNS